MTTKFPWRSWAIPWPSWIASWIGSPCDEKGAEPSTGIPYVLVNGTIVVKESKVLKGMHPVQSIRFQRQQSGFKPLVVGNWKFTFYAVPVDFGGELPNSQPKTSGVHGHPFSHSGTDFHAETGFKGCC